MAAGPDTQRVLAAEELLERAEFEPAWVLDRISTLADSALDVARSSVVWRAASLAARSLDRLDDAVEYGRRSVASARTGGDPALEADARVTLALALFTGGRTRQALAELDRAALVARGTAVMRVLAQRALLLERAGRLDEALALYDEAIRHPAAVDHLDVLLTDRGIALALSGRFAEAVADLERVCELTVGRGSSSIHAYALHNLGFAHAAAGRLASALVLFDEADAMLTGLGFTVGKTLVARARALLAARLHDEAAEAAQTALDEFERTGARADAAETRVLVAQAALRRGDPAAAPQARAAATALRRQGRGALAALADHTGLQARVRTGHVDRRTLAAAERTADALLGAGMTADALEARLTAGLLARQLGDAERARVHLTHVSAQRADGLLADRLRGWHAEALLRLDRGERTGARRAVAAGIELVREMQAMLGAADLQAAAAGSGVALADVGLELALGDDDAWEVLRWIERWRAGSLGLGLRTEAPADLAGDLDALRAALRRAEDAQLRGDDATVARRQVAQLESAIRARSRHSAGRTPGGVVRADLMGQLGDTVLVTYFELRGRIGAVTVADGRARLHADLGIDLAEVARIGEAVFFALRRLGAPGRSPLAQQAGRVALERALGRLEERLLAPLATDLGDPGRPVLVCPTGALLALPWGGLASLRHRAVGVVPSLAARADDGRGGGRVVLAAGPGLAGAVAEIARLAAVYPDAARFDADRAHTAAVLAALEGASVAHFACHGTVRADNPMFSSLRLTDGPLTVYDLERLQRAPEVVVLAACDVGTSAVRAGGELLGLVSALMRAGTEAVVASVVPVPDAALVGFMTTLHEALRAGAPVAEALRRARAALDPDDPVALALASAFTCFGGARPGGYPASAPDASASRLAQR